MARPSSSLVATRYDLVAVAEVYLEAIEVGDNPTAAVAEAWQISRTAAAKLVHRTRALGHLAPTRKGYSPGLNRKLIAVAEAVGVTPQALHSAIIEHANGDLRCRREITA